MNFLVPESAVNFMAIRSAVRFARKTMLNRVTITLTAFLSRREIIFKKLPVGGSSFT
jgi:hypothetical protein